MAAMRGPRLQVGSAAWVAEERSSALQIIESEVEEFSYSARNEMDWLNEHMAGIFDENETNFADTFKTPGKLRGKTPRTARKPLATEARVPLSDVFAATPNVPSSHFSPRFNHFKSPQVLRDATASSPEIHRSPSPRKPAAALKAKDTLPDTQDSGYYGSQDIAPASQSFREAFGELHATMQVPVKLGPNSTNTGDSPEKTFQTAREEQTTRTIGPEAVREDEIAAPEAASPAPEFQVSSPLQHEVDEADKDHDGVTADGEDTPSEASSPARPYRKSSLNFAPFPAREPLTAVKANPGGRVSRVSHVDQIMSYYDRPAGGKGLANVTVHGSDDAEDSDKATSENGPSNPIQTKYEGLAANHHKTYTQRLQDQISLLGKSQPHIERPTKQVLDGIATHKLVSNAIQVAQVPRSPSPLPMATLKSTPGAFPEDEDDWIEPPTIAQEPELAPSPRPALPKSHSADIMEGLHQSIAAGEPLDMLSSPLRQTVHETQRPVSSFERSLVQAAAPETSPLLSTETLPLHKAATVADLRLGSTSTLPAPKSPTRSYRDSPLKHVKNKLSSILKSFEKGATLSADGKPSVLSPSKTRLGHFSGLSMESLVEKLGPARDPQPEPYLANANGSPTRPVGKRTRASLEKEKEEKKRDKDAKVREEQYEKLEKARAHERERARDVSKEKETAEKQNLASWKDAAQSQKTPKTTRTSPRKPRGADESTTKHPEPDVELSDAPSTIPQPAPRSVGPTSALRTRELRRPTKPAKDASSKSKQTPTLIRVNTGSQHSQLMTSSGAVLAAPTEPDSAAQMSQTQPPLTSKVSKPLLKSKPSTQSLRAPPSATRLKPLDAAAKKKEQDEREVLRKREAKAETERKRLVAQEDQRKVEQLRRQEAERQKQKEREQLAQSEEKKNAQRQAAIEKAKHTRAPPPAVRNHTHGVQDHVPQHDKGAPAFNGAKGEGSRPPSRMTSGVPRSQEEPGRLTATQATKVGVKRTLPGAAAEDAYRSGLNRAGPSYQAKDAKRRRTSDDFDDKHDGESHPNIKGPPVRPSTGLKKDISTKAAYPTNYPNPPQSATNLYKGTGTAQLYGQTKSAHLLDMAQVSNGAIPFAPQASTATAYHTKTPVRTTGLNGMKAPAAKSVAKPSPKFQNGEAIELPEIQTDDEDEDEDKDRNSMIPKWADSPNLRILIEGQQGTDPGLIFGPPRPLNMEEVFFKSKEKFHKFRSRTSSANWTGADRLTEEDIQKDLAARDKLRREGGWSYEMSNNLL